VTTLASTLHPRHNSFNALRLLFAAVVIISHAPLVGGWRNPYLWGGLEVGGWAVGGFFAISGWLITGSRLRLSLLTFLWNRTVRIYPAYWAALVVTAFVIVPISIAFDPGASAHIVSAIKYVLKDLTLIQVQDGIQHTLVHAAYPGMWNLSLWTLKWEFACYVGIGLFLSVGYFRRHRWVLLALFLATTALLVKMELAHPFSKPGTAALALQLAAFFLAGAVLKRYADVIPSSVWIAAAAIVALTCLCATNQARPLSALPIAYLTLYLAGTVPLQRFGRRHDISYGMYIYAFPIEQLLALAGATRWGVAPYAALSVAAVIPLAALSWLLIERPALRLKGRTGRHTITLPPDAKLGSPATPAPGSQPAGVRTVDWERSSSPEHS
jgi:peptidoglycan/LPS O-acetylase OafA/YrhL